MATAPAITVNQMSIFIFVPLMLCRAGWIHRFALEPDDKVNSTTKARPRDPSKALKIA